MTRSDNKLGAVTIDVDGINCYRAIHGLALEKAGPDPIYTQAMPRFLSLCQQHHIQATLFVVGQDLSHPAHAECIAEAARQGHEIASHSHRHDYGLSQRSPASIRADLERASDTIEQVTGKRPVGFRAPGYNLSEDLVTILEQMNFRYDSSLFPAPLYFSARALAIALYRLRGRPSHSLQGDAREFLADPYPFRPARTARFRPARENEESRTLWEIPMSVSTPLRLPWIGTTIAMAPELIGRILTRQVLRANRPSILELHGIDFAAAEDGYEDALVMAQPDLKVPLHKKVRRLSSVVSALAKNRKIQSMERIADSFEAGR
jgi:peptidoglycan-N-acetylglucosamine deacetylase